MNALISSLATADTLLFFGIASGVLSTFAYIPYIIDTIAGRTQPQRASWLIWSVLGSIAFGSQLYEGATSSLWFAGVQVSGTIIVFSLSIRSGKGRYLSNADYAILLAAALGLMLWYYTETAAYALAITISISLLGGTATIIKAYRDPGSETLITWVISLIASACAIVSVGKFDLIILAYPLYLFILYIAFVAAIALGRLSGNGSDRNPTVAMQRFSLTPAVSVLRISADCIIVCAALVFTLNWLNNGNDVKDRAATVNLKNTSVVSSTLRASNNVLNGTFPVVLPTAPVLDFPPEPFTLPSLTQSASDSTNEPPMLLFSLQLDEGEANQLWNLESNDPLTEALKIKIASWLTHDRDLRTDKKTPSAAALPKPASDTLPTPWTLSEVAIVPTGENTTQRSNPPGDSKSFQFLDSDDPFTRLTVTSANARLLNTNFQTELPGTALPRGTHLKAIATNGHWFRVQTPGGDIGYIAHDDVSLDALAMVR